MESNSIIFLNWTAPFTLDISGVDPDIDRYCVDVVNVNSNSSLHDDLCGSETELNYTLPGSLSYCDELLFIVTPINRAGFGEARGASYGIASAGT